MRRRIFDCEYRGYEVINFVLKKRGQHDPAFFIGKTLLPSLQQLLYSQDR
jgi:hypothetical protein